MERQKIEIKELRNKLKMKKAENDELQKEFNKIVNMDEEISDKLNDLLATKAVINMGK